MDLAAVWTMALSDLRQRVRDRSVLIFALVVPIALMVVFSALFSGLGSSESLGEITVSVAAAPDDQAATALVGVLDGIDGLDITAKQVPLGDVDELSKRVEDERLTVGVVFPKDFSTQLTTGGSPQVELIQGGDGSLEASVTGSIVQGYVDRVSIASQAAAVAGGNGASPEQLAKIAQDVATAEPLLTATTGKPSDEQLSTQGYLVAGQAALFMFFTISFGVVAYIQEREMGTLPRLASMPFPPRSIMVAKALVSFILGVSATSVLLIVGSLLFGVSFGNPAAVAVLIVVAVAAVTSMVLLITRIARTAEQASVATSILGLLMGVLGGSFFPVTGSGLLSRISDLTPVAAFIRGLGITFGGGGVGDLAVPLLTLGAFGALALIGTAFLGDGTVSA